MRFPLFISLPMILLAGSDPCVQAAESRPLNILFLFADDWGRYPQRAIRTSDHLLIINFRPDRWPLGDPYRLDDEHPPTADEITNVTRITHPDEDAGPTKAWLVGQRNSAEWQSHYEWVYGKRPKYELYDLKKDPHETKNVADDPQYASVKMGLERRLVFELTRTGDPRLIDDGRFFETPPLAGR
jgi:hypothetical protein